MKCDVTDTNQLVQTFQKIHSEFPSRNISILVNNAGRMAPITVIKHKGFEPMVPAADMEPLEAVEHVKGLIELNITSYIIVTRIASEYFDHEKPGIIINVGSVYGSRKINGTGHSIYGASKHA